MKTNNNKINFNGVYICMDNGHYCKRNIVIIQMENIQIKTTKYE